MFSLPARGIPRSSICILKQQILGYVLITRRDGSTYSQVKVATRSLSCSVNSDTLLYRESELSILLYRSPFPEESTARHELSINCKYHHRERSVIERQSRTDCRLLSYRCDFSSRLLRDFYYSLAKISFPRKIS